MRFAPTYRIIYNKDLCKQSAFKKTVEFKQRLFVKQSHLIRRQMITKSFVIEASLKDYKMVTKMHLKRWQNDKEDLLQKKKV